MSHFIEDLKGTINKAMAAVGVDNDGEGFGGEWEGEGLHLIGDLPHGLPVAGAAQGAEELIEFLGGGGVMRLRACPGEEAEGFNARGGAGSEDAIDEFGGNSDWELVEGALQVKIAADDVGDVMDGCEVVVAVGAGRI